MSATATARVAAGLFTADNLLLKAAGASRLSQVLLVERRLFKQLGNTFFERARRGVAGAVTAIRAGTGPVQPHELERALGLVDAAFDGWAEDMRPVLWAATDQAYRIGKDAIFEQASTPPKQRTRLELDSPHLTADELRTKASLRSAGLLKPRFDLADVAAVEALADNQVFWVGEHYQSNLRKRVRSVSSHTVLVRGLGRRQAARELQKNLAAELGFDPSKPFDRSKGIGIPVGWKGNSIQYFEGLATNTATVGRTSGSMRGLQQLGVEKYVISNPSDRRTCQRCDFMNGKEFKVEGAMGRINDTINARTPTAVRSIHPWARNVGQLKASKDLQGDGFGYPPFHFR